MKQKTLSESNSEMEVISPLTTLNRFLARSTIPKAKQEKFLKLVKLRSMALSFDLTFVTYEQSLTAAFLKHNSISLLRQLPCCFSTNGNPVWSFPDKSMFLWSERKGGETSHKALAMFQT